ncbi:glutathione S-transferase T3-like [Salvia hispanica]|uniref:glutathione S-transferase T3-like n=1 Tax=Salvia hispanica TaxID=49212 RepID=UPI00200934AF|nr:glutathione S-transferase T3-like [Salvia hispanica]
MAGTEPDEYLPFDTNAEYDPDFSTDSYGLSDMEPSPRRPSAPRGRPAAPSAAAASGSATKKKWTKAQAQKLPTTEIDVSEDPVYANNQRVTAYWERIAEKYNAAKPANAYKRHKEQLRKHWDQIKKQVNLFAAEYEKCEREQASGESLADVRDKAMQSYILLYGDFKHYQSWALLRDKQKFVGGVIPQSMAARRRASKRTFNAYTSSDSGASPMDLNSPVFEDESSGTPMSSRRPPGVKAAKGKATSTSVAPR